MNPQPSDPWREPGPDPGVLNAAQRGELVALFSMLRAHRMELWRVCLALTLDHRRAERLFHETLVRAAKNLRTVPPGSPILHWLTRLATHLAVAWTRQEGPRRPGEPTGDWPGGGAESPLAGDPRLLAALADLSVPDRLLLALAVVERLGYGDVARVTKIETLEVVRRLTRLRARLAGEAAA